MEIRVTDPDTRESVVLERTEQFEEDCGKHRSVICKHPEKTVCKAQMQDGRPQYRDQCKTCGALCGPARKQTDDLRGLPDADATLALSYNQTREAAYNNILRKHISLQSERVSEWWKNYNEYLLSPAWQEKRKSVLKRAHKVCEGCLQNTATQVHHKTYDHVGDELLFELVAVCDHCHERLHPKFEE